MIHQLRIYEIFESNKAAFHSRFAEHAARIMRTYGFDIVEMWETRKAERIEFVYLLRWPDADSMKRGWDAFMADAEWAEIKRVTSAAHGRLVGSIEDRALILTDYSPSFARRRVRSDRPRPVFRSTNSTISSLTASAWVTGHMCPPPAISR